METISMERGPERRVLIMQWVTLVWMTVECSIALSTAWRARRVSLLARGSDSVVEFISASVVSLQFAPRRSISQARGAKSAVSCTRPCGRRAADRSARTTAARRS